MKNYFEFDNNIDYKTMFASYDFKVEVLGDKEK